MLQEGKGKSKFGGGIRPNYQKATNNFENWKSIISKLVVYHHYNYLAHDYRYPFDKKKENSDNIFLSDMIYFIL